MYKKTEPRKDKSEMGRGKESAKERGKENGGKKTDQKQEKERTRKRAKERRREKEITDHIQGKVAYALRGL